ncbi:MAG: hypothetical protein JWO91_2759 [Acidobacteriaceae bacterium]|nr:hypothetical protein [Acidobacteriaceae bacterium]
MRYLPQYKSRYLVLMVFYLGITIASSTALFAASVSLSCKPDTLWFGSVVVGQTKKISVSMTNNGSSTATVSSVSRTGTSFNTSGLTLPISLGAGQSKQFMIAFSPQTAQHLDGQFTFSIVGSTTVLNLYAHGNGTHGLVTSSPSSVNFGNVALTTNKQVAVTLTNPTNATVSVSKAIVSGSGFSRSGLSLPLSLTGGQSFTFKAIFAPTVAGNATGTITVTANTYNLVIPLSGAGTSSAGLSISPGSLPFGAVTVGSTKTLSATLSASGTSVTVSSATLNSSEFSLSGVTFPFTILAGKTASFNVTFAPKASGSVSAALAFSSNASNSSISQTLTGQGQAGASHSVDLSWNADTGSVSGYNVYRGTKTGGPYSKINTSLDSSTTYVDSNVTSGQTYFYVTTAVGTSGVQSGYSNQVQAVIP